MLIERQWGRRYWITKYVVIVVGSGTWWQAVWGRKRCECGGDKVKGGSTLQSSTLSSYLPHSTLHPNDSIIFHLRNKLAGRQAGDLPPPTRFVLVVVVVHGIKSWVRTLPKTIMLLFSFLLLCLLLAYDLTHSSYDVCCHCISRAWKSPFFFVINVHETHVNI